MAIDVTYTGEMQVEGSLQGTSLTDDSKYVEAVDQDVKLGLKFNLGDNVTLPPSYPFRYVWTG